MVGEVNPTSLRVVCWRVARLLVGEVMLRVVLAVSSVIVV